MGDPRSRDDDGLDSLLQSKRLLQRELDRSHETLNVLYESHTRLQRSRENLHAQGRFMTRASSVLKNIQQRQELERIMLVIACGIFFFVCGIIIIRRTLLPWVSFFAPPM